MDQLCVQDVEELHRLAVDQPDVYYGALVRHLGIRFIEPYQTFLDQTRGLPFPRWFEGGRINLVDTCVRARCDGPEGGKAAVVTCLEDGGRRQLSFADLADQVASLAAWLRHRGIGRGDCVGLFMPLVPEATVAFFACAWTGAIAVPAFSGYGPDALAERLRNSEAKVLFTAGGFRRRGSWVDMDSVVRAVIPKVPSLSYVVRFDLASAVPGQPGRSDEGGSEPVWTSWTDAYTEGTSLDRSPPETMDPNEPVLVMYTSGTTGRPKGIVHSHGGFLVKVAGDFAIAFDVHADDTVAWVTDLGWLVGPMMMVGNAAIGSTALYYVGGLDHPDLHEVWRVCEREAVTTLGISPTAVRTMAAAGGSPPAETHDLSRLRTLLSTGEPWDPASWRWLFEQVGAGAVPILNYTGGTEIGGGILTGYAALPIRECAFSGPVVGMDAEVLSRDGAPLIDTPGELVVKNVWPGMTHSFWGGDDQGYLDTYWSEIPGVWLHGDLARRDAHGWWYVIGRSDDTIKVAGRRVGPAEIESALLQCAGVGDAAVVGIPDAARGQVIVAFVVRVAGAPSSAAAITAEVGDRLGRALGPSEVVFVEALPRTRNGKIMRRAIRARYLGSDPGDLSSLEGRAGFEAIPHRPDTESREARP